MHVLITGGAGYIGSHVCKALSERGFIPVTVDNLINGHKSAVNWGPLITANLSDVSVLKQVLHDYRPIAAIHLAAFAYVGESINDPQKYYRNNLICTLDLLRTLLEHDVTKFVFSSSCAIFGECSSQITEKTKKNPINPYGRSKLMIEQILEDYDLSFSFKSICLRYFNAAGADPSGVIGESHNPETHLIPNAIQAAQGKGPELVVFGKNHETADGSCIRDYVHVCDLATAHVLAIEKLLADERSEQFNLGYGQGHSIFEILELVEGISGKKVPYKISNKRDGDPPKLVCDPSKALKQLRWQPEFNSMDRIIKKTAWDWHLDPKF